MRRGTRPRRNREPMRKDKRIQLGRTTAENAQCAVGWSVRRKPNGDGRVARKGRTRYFLLQPSLPLIQATLVRGVFVSIARVRPVFFLRASLSYKSITRSGSRIRTIASTDEFVKGQVATNGSVHSRIGA